MDEGRCGVGGSLAVLYTAVYPRCDCIVWSNGGWMNGRIQCGTIQTTDSETCLDCWYRDML